MFRDVCEGMLVFLVMFVLPLGIGAAWEWWFGTYMLWYEGRDTFLKWARTWAKGMVPIITLVLIWLVGSYI